MLHLEFELNESVNVLIMINIWFVFVIHVYAKFCSKLWVRDKIVQMLCISIIWIINTAFMLFFFFLSLFKTDIMPKTKAMSRRRAAPVDLREPVLPLERQDVTPRTGTNGRTSRKRSSHKNNPIPQIQIPQSLSGVGDNHISNEHLASPVALSQNTHISANDIAASLLNQLKNSGLTLAPLSLPVDSAA